MKTCTLYNDREIKEPEQRFEREPPPLKSEVVRGSELLVKSLVVRAQDLTMYQQNCLNYEERLVKKKCTESVWLYGKRVNGQRNGLIRLWSPSQRKATSSNVQTTEQSLWFHMPVKSYYELFWKE